MGWIPRGIYTRSNTILCLASDGNNGVHTTRWKTTRWSQHGSNPRVDTMGWISRGLFHGVEPTGWIQQGCQLNGVETTRWKPWGANNGVDIT